MATKRTWPDVAIAPGETLAEEIAARGMSQKALAEKMGRPLQAINEIVLGKKQITAATALQLEDTLGVLAETWMNLEIAYQLTKARLSRSRSRLADGRHVAVRRERSSRRVSKTGPVLRKEPARARFAPAGRRH